MRGTTLCWDVEKESEKLNKPEFVPAVELNDPGEGDIGPYGVFLGWNLQPFVDYATVL